MKISQLHEELRRRERDREKPRDWSEIKWRVEAAMAKVVERDFELLEDGPSERAVAHRLAVSRGALSRVARRL
jgi:hypothetical protein